MGMYEIARIPRITGGAGARAQAGALALGQAGEGAHVLLVADPGLAATGFADEIKASLRKAKLKFTTFSDFSSDPTVERVDAAAAIARLNGTAVVIAFGGGSALDLGKAVAAIARTRNSALHYELCRKPFARSRLKSICIPTTSGTGAETTRTAIITRADKAKVWLWGESIKADEVILDPELTISLPAHLTAATGIDALVHAVEAATNRHASEGKNFYAFEAIRLIARHLETAVKDPGNLPARAAVQRAAALAGIAIDNGGTAIAHNIGHAMGSLKSIHHGRAVGTAMLASLPWNTQGDDGRYAACALAMGAKASAAGFVSAYEKLVRACGLGISVAAEFAGVTPRMLAAQMARPENAAMRASNWRETSEADLLALATATLAVQ